MKKRAKKPKEFVLKNHLEKTLRASFKKTPLYNEAKKRAKFEYFETTKHGKQVRRVHYKCACCGGFFKDQNGEIAVDHIDPVVDTKVGWVDANTYADRLFCSIDNLQVLCNYKGERNGIKSCHKIKTIKERQELADTLKAKRSK